MLRIYGDFLQVLREMRPVIEKIERRDSDLSRQLRRAAASVALNMSEGSGSEGGTRRQRYLNALGSARETLSCLEVADALGYAEIGGGGGGSGDGAVLAGLNRVIGGCQFAGSWGHPFAGSWGQETERTTGAESASIRS